MKKSLLIFFLLAGIETFAQSDSIQTDSSWKNIYRGEAAKVNNLVHTKLDVRFDYTKSYMYGREWLTAQPHFYPTDSLTLDAKGMNINEVALFANGKKTPLKYSYDSMFLRIKLNKTYKADENYTVYIDYVSKPDEWREKGSAAITDAKGLYFINPLGKDSAKATEIWTQGETEHNSVWMPTIDKPNQKLTDEISMTVPDKYVTLSNGLLVNKKKNSDGTRTDTWKMDMPQSPYLFFMGVGDYSIVKDSYKGKEVAYYVEKEYEPVARGIFGHTPEMIKFYSEKLGIDFPWQKYDQIVGRDYVSGAMENTTSTLHGDGAYQNARELKDGNAWEDVIAHELFHQWFGDLVTCESWSNLTMNESFADFSETLWNEYKYGKDKGDETNYTAMQNYLNSGSEDKTLVRFHYADKEDMFDDVSYAKGGRILNMLRNYVGDNAFFASLHTYLTDNKFKTGEAQQLRLAFESVTGQDLNWFWNEWYYGAGHPVLDINYVYNDSAHKVNVIVEQNQTQQIFKMPVYIDMYNGPNKVRHQVWIQNQVDTFTFSYTTKPDLINFDGDKTLLCEKIDHKTDDNFRAQLKYAPLYADRREALQYFADKNMTKDLSLGLNDAYYGIRSFTLDRLGEVEGAMKDTALQQSFVHIAQTETDNKTKAKALTLLASVASPAYKPLFEKGINDSSYSVAGASLIGLSNLDPSGSYALAAKYAQDARGDLNEIVTTIFMLTGKPDDYNIIASKYEALPTQSKLNLTTYFCNYLSKLGDEQNIKDGVDKVVAFRNKIPSAYKENLYPVINGALQKIGVAKGGNVQAYVDNAIKE
ncbi:M1 family metallopeptidase [Parafilimonas sp.]|uniref:M1 family metallopeptidase n=1 Tax=Parafilimonas sp. TaxID=1969739 RepID=UPI0039E3AE1A